RHTRSYGDWSSDVCSSDLEEIAGGSIVGVRDERGRFVGQALYSSRSEISLRLLTLGEEQIDRDWWRTRLRAAARRREGIAPDAKIGRASCREGGQSAGVVA